MTSKEYLRPLSAVILLHMAIWLVVYQFISVPPDMADHWVWSRQLFWGYYEHPPMIAVFIRAFTWFAADPVIALKLSVGIFTAILYFLMSRLAAASWGGRSALVFVVLVVLAPYFNTISLFWHIQPMLFFWILGLFCCLEFSRTKKPNLILLFALVSGFGMLSKYTFVLLYVSCFIWILTTPSFRFLWRTWQLWCAPLLSLAVFSPNIYWNMTHNWASMAFVLEKGLSSSGAGWGSFLGFTVGHLVLFNPLISVTGIYQLASFKLRNLGGTSDFTRLLIITVLVSLGLFSYAAFKGSHADPLWVETGYLSLLLLLARRIDLVWDSRKKLLKASLFACGTFLVFLWTIAFSQAFYSWLPVPYDSDRTKWLIDWPDTASKVERIIREDNNGVIPPALIAREYQLAGSMSLYLSNHPFFFTLEKLERNQWAGKEDILAQPANYLICREYACGGVIEDAREMFGRGFAWIGRAHTYRNGKPVRLLSVYKMYKE